MIPIIILITPFVITIILFIIIVIISTLRAFRRARDGAAKGRGSWERARWLGAKFEATSAKSDMRNEQQRVNEEDIREDMREESRDNT